MIARTKYCDGLFIKVVFLLWSPYIEIVTTHGTVMSDVTFKNYIDGERARLTETRENAFHEMAQWQHRVDMIDREFAAIDAYEAAKSGKQSSNGAARNKTVRAPRGSRREAILSAVSAAPNGLSRGDLLNFLGVRGDKSGEVSVSNALTAMTKAGALAREDGMYHAPAMPLQAAAE